MSAMTPLGFHFRGAWGWRGMRLARRMMRVPAPLAVAFVGIVLTCGFTYEVAVHWDAPSAQRQLNALGENRALLVEDGLADIDQLVGAVSERFAPTIGVVSRDEFVPFANRLRQRFRALGGVVWMPLVPREDRAEHEAAAAREGLASYHILERLADGSLVPVRDRPDYLPALYVAGDLVSLPVPGTDLAAIPEVRRAMDRAVETGTAAATGLLPLVTYAGTRSALVLLHPVFWPGRPQATAKQRRAATAGFFAGIVAPRIVLAEILHGIKSPQGLDIHFFGADPRPDDQPFYTRWSLLRDADGTAPSFADLDAGIHWTGTVSLADARITIVAAPMPDAPVLAAYNRARLVLIAGLVLTAVTVLYVFLSQRISAEARAARRQLFFSNLLLNTAMEATPDGMLIVDDGMRILSTNGRFAELFRVPTTLLVAKQDSPVLEWVAAQAKDRAAFVARVRYLYDHPEEIAHEDLLLADGRVLDRHSAPLFATDNHYLGRIWFFRDVSEERIAEQQLSELARVDGLTGIANRRAFTERLAQAFAAARRGEMGFAVLALDLDHFKDINDNFGHPAGDAVLAELGRRLRGAVRETDMVARLGGDEFAILQSGVDGRDDAATFADKLRRVLAQPYRLEMATVHATASIGVSVYTPATTAAASLLEQADRALYRAKQEGRDRYCFEPADAVPAASACALAS